MATISNTPRPGYVWDATDNCWYPIGVGAHSHNEIPKTIVDAKGDLIVGTAADTVDRLAVGTNGQVLSADSTESTGLKWIAAPTSGTNWSLVNSGGTALTGAATITVSGITGADKLMIIIDEASSVNASANIGIRFNSDSTSNYYRYGGSFSYSTAYSVGNFDRVSGADAKISVAALSSVAASRANGYVYLTGGNAAGNKMFIANGMASQSTGNGAVAYNTGGYYNSASTISSVSIVSDSGNFDNGTLYVYKSA